VGWREAGWSNANRAGGIVFTLAIQTRGKHAVRASAPIFPASELGKAVFIWIDPMPGGLCDVAIPHGT
jgi:hypothetical protein